MSADRRRWLIAALLYVAGTLAFLIDSRGVLQDGVWIAAALFMAIPAILGSYVCVGAWEVIRSIAARKKQRQAEAPWQRASHKRNCYCGVWDTEPAAYEKAGYSLGFCGVCERCGAPGHTRHFPGPVPYTSAWCDKCYRMLAWTWPFRSRAGWGLLLAVAMLLALPAKAVYDHVVRKNFVATMQQEVGRSVNDEQSYRLRHRDWLRVTRALPNGNKEERYADNGREACLLVFELNGARVVKWHFQDGCWGGP